MFKNSYRKEPVCLYICVCACIPLASFNPHLQEGRNRVEPLALFSVCVSVGGSAGTALCAAFVDCYVCHL